MPDTKIQLLRRFFFSRADVVAISAPWEGNRGAPCPARVESDEHLSGLLIAHILGIAAPEIAVTYRTSRGDGQATGRYRIGSYTPAPDGTTRWVCLDFDGAGHADALEAPLGAAQEAFDKAVKVGLTPYLERSGSATGWHVWVFFEPGVEATLARKIGHALAPSAKLANGGNADSKAGRGIEVFPKQDAIRGENGLGNLVWLPWWIGAAEGGCLFCNREGDPEEPDEIHATSPDEVWGVLARLEPPRATEKPTKIDHDDWRRRALERLDLGAVYGSSLTGRSGVGWLECRDPWSTSGDKNPSSGVADGTGEAERGSFHSFRTGETLSVFDFLIKRDGVDFKGAAEEIARMSGVEREKKKATKKSAATKNAADMGETAAASWLEQLAVSDKGSVKVSLANLIHIFENDEEWKKCLGYNLRTQQVVFMKDPPDSVGAKFGNCLTDEFATRASIWLQNKYDFILRTSSIIYSAMVTVAHLHQFDPVRDWLEALELWDATERLDHWLTAVTGCDDGPYETAVGRRFLISAVARVFDPGCKVDTMLILHGAQGTMKSKMLAELAVRPEWFSDHLAEIGGKDAALQLCGPWILEMAELDALTGKRENERVKAWLTQQHDRFRPPYGRSVVDVPRRVVFTGTSNLDQFLRDETGGRRFWPIKIREINIDLLRTIRVQLWAEVLHAYRASERWWLEGDEVELAKEQQEDRRVRDPWEDTVPAWLDETDFSSKSSPMRAANGRRICTTAGEILTDAVKVPIERQTKKELDRIGRILGNKLGWVRGKRRVEGRLMSVWYPPQKTGDETVVELVREERGEPEQSKFGGVEDW